MHALHAATPQNDIHFWTSAQMPTSRRLGKRRYKYTFTVVSLCNKTAGWLQGFNVASMITHFLLFNRPTSVPREWLVTVYGSNSQILGPVVWSGVPFFFCRCALTLKATTVYTRPHIYIYIYRPHMSCTWQAKYVPSRVKKLTLNRRMRTYGLGAILGQLGLSDLWFPESDPDCWEETDYIFRKPKDMKIPWFPLISALGSCRVKSTLRL